MSTQPSSLSEFCFGETPLSLENLKFADFIDPLNRTARQQLTCLDHEFPLNVFSLRSHEDVEHFSNARDAIDQLDVFIVAHVPSQDHLKTLIKHQNYYSTSTLTMNCLPTHTKDVLP